jgi:Arc/MetJ-type ribon-helix-helix transcriptional regulator
MILSVRIPPRIEQELADYCARNRVSKSDAVKDALEQFLSGKSSGTSPYELMKDLIGPHTDEPASEDIARHTKRLLRERVRATRK